MMIYKERPVTYPDINNGLGVRASLWLQGCGVTPHCAGCHNAGLQGTGGEEMTVSEVMELLSPIMDGPHPCHGLSILGGDPLARPADELMEIAALCEAFRERWGGDVWIFTGLYPAEIMDDEARRRAALSADYLKTGRWVAAERELGLAYRTSRNQKIWRVSGEALVDASADFDECKID